MKAAKTKIVKTQRRLLERWAVQAFKVLYRVGGTTAELSGDVAGTVGKEAARMEMAESELSKWLQEVYGRIWVKQTNLNPGLDFKDVRATVLASYNKLRQRGESCES